jgi:hypothetical protein
VEDEIMPGSITASLGSLLFEQDMPDGYVLTIEGDGEGEGLDGWFDGPPTIRDGKRRLWTHGRFSERGYRDSRIITVQGLVLASSDAGAAAAQEAITGVIADGSADTFTVNDSITGTRYCQVYLADGTGPKVRWITDRTARYMIQLEAPDPRKYGTPVSGSTPPVEPGGGLGFDMFTQNTLGILDFGSVGQAGTVTIQNTGTANAYPKFTVAGEILVGFDIKEVSTGYTLRYSAAVADGSTVILNARDATVTQGGADRSVFLTRREWTLLAPGETATYMLLDLFSYNANALMTVEVTPSWF